MLVKRGGGGVGVYSRIYGNWGILLLTIPIIVVTGVLTAVQNVFVSIFSQKDSAL